MGRGEDGEKTSEGERQNDIGIYHAKKIGREDERERMRAERKILLEEEGTQGKTGDESGKRDWGTMA